MEKEINLCNRICFSNSLKICHKQYKKKVHLRSNWHLNFIKLDFYYVSAIYNSQEAFASRELLRVEYKQPDGQ